VVLRWWTFPTREDAIQFYARLMQQNSPVQLSTDTEHSFRRTGSESALYELGFVDYPTRSVVRVQCSQASCFSGGARGWADLTALARGARDRLPP
jgi:hypothetical protein